MHQLNYEELLPYQQYWTPPFSFGYPYNLSSPLIPETESPFVLKFLNYMCAGCEPDDPPFDLCVSHEENITLTNPNNKKTVHEENQIALSSHSILKYPTFQLASLVVPLEIRPQLTTGIISA